MKKFLSIVLALVMMMALALPAFAADEIVVKTYDELKNAIDNTDASEINIKLGSNITTDVAISGRDSHTVKINLNGYTLSPSSFETNWGHTLIICDSSKKPGYIIGRNISNRGTIIIRDVNVNIDNATNKGLLYITGKHSKVSKFRLDAGSNSSAFVGKGMASASYLPDSKKDSLVIVEVDDIAGVSEVNQTGTVVYMDFNNDPMDFDTFASLSKTALKEFEMHGRHINLPTLTCDNAKFLKWSKSSVEVDKRTAVSASWKYIGGVKVDANGGTCNCEALDVYTDGKLVGNLPTAEYSGFCFEGWFLNDKPVTDQTVFKKGDIIKAKWSAVADHADYIRDALKKIGMNNADIEKVIKLFSSNSLVGSVVTNGPVWGVVIATLMLGCFAGGLAIGKKKK